MDAHTLYYIFKFCDKDTQLALKLVSKEFKDVIERIWEYSYFPFKVDACLMNNSGFLSMFSHDELHVLPGNSRSFAGIAEYIKKKNEECIDAGKVFQYRYFYVGDNVYFNAFSACSSCEDITFLRKRIVVKKYCDSCKKELEDRAKWLLKWDKSNLQLGTGDVQSLVVYLYKIKQYFIALLVAKKLWKKKETNDDYFKTILNIIGYFD